MKLLKPHISFPFVVRRVQGHSMLPTIKPGWIVIGKKTNTVVFGDVVIADVNGIEQLKRVVEIKKKLINLAGDNHEAGHDAGWVPKYDVIARIIYPKV